MTEMLEAMKALVTNALELKANEPNDILNAYYRGKVIGVLEVASSGILSRREHAQFLEHYESEKERLL